MSVVRIATRLPVESAVLEAVLRAPGVLMQTAAWVTLIFAVIEFVACPLPSEVSDACRLPSADWLPSALPPVEMDAATREKAAQLLPMLLRK